MNDTQKMWKCERRDKANKRGLGRCGKRPKNVHIHEAIEMIRCGQINICTLVVYAQAHTPNALSHSVNEFIRSHQRR